MAFLFLMPFALTPTLLPLACEALAEYFLEREGMPIHLGLSLLECAALVGFYRLAIGWEGNLLQRREQLVLEGVTAKVE